MSKLRLPRLISSGMVLQQKKKPHIWGWDEPGSKIMVSFLGEDYVASADEDGRFEMWLRDNPAGGPYTMLIRNDSGEEEVLRDILIGDVWICSGQSNMELPMSRVIDNFPEELADCRYPSIRSFKITEHGDFHGPLEELLTGEWKQCSDESLMGFSALSYFFAKQAYKLTGVPVGLINASLGGTRIESWMSSGMLEGYDEFLETAKRYSDDRFVEERIRQNESQSSQWHKALDEQDEGLKNHWESEEIDETGFGTLNIPVFFRDTELNGFIGSIWLRRRFTVPDIMVGEAARVWLGTIVDSDTVYINGVQVGHTDYQYPPRKYQIPAGLLKKENTIAIRVKVDTGKGRFTPGKKYAVFNENGEVVLTGSWKYRIGARCGCAPENDFINWKPTGLYNGMLSPCHKYTVGGIIWYQGESNAGRYGSYLDLTKRMISGWRQKWNDDRLPFLYVQLPNFEIDLAPASDDILRECASGCESGSGWPQLREQQRRALAIPYTGMAVAIDAGEDNDLHPVNKKDIGMRLAYLAISMLYGGDKECCGPQAEKITAASGACAARAELQCSHAKGGMYAYSSRKGSDIKDFELMDENGRWHQAAAELDGSRIVLSCEGMQGKPVYVRYCYSNTNKGALVYNRSGYPMSPFVEKI